MTHPQEAARNLAGSAGGDHVHHHDTPLLIGTRETCKALGISDRKRFQLTKDGVLPCSKIGTRLAYPVAGLRAWVDAGCPTEPGSAATLRWTTGGEA